MGERYQEVAGKLALIRNCLGDQGALRLRGTDWFAWATAGASNTVLLTAETGVAEVLVTPDEAWILTDEIEARRLQDEELSDNFRIFAGPWAHPGASDEFTEDRVDGCFIYSDRPRAKERTLPEELIQHKRTLTPSETNRYRSIGKLAAEAMTEAMAAAQPDWTEQDLAGAGACALWRRGLHPALTLAAGSERLQRYRHPTPTSKPLGKVAMLVFCARGGGLYANLTRFVAFEPLTTQDKALHEQVQDIEAEALRCCIPGTRLNQIYDVLADAYQRRGQGIAIDAHHQGGLTGYLAREIVANPETGHVLKKNEVVAWNPSLPGTKIEDTFLIHDGLAHDPEHQHGLENLTYDRNWPTKDVSGLLRPLVWER